jgi:hypothetical protein
MTCDLSPKYHAFLVVTGGLSGDLSRVVPRENRLRGTARRAGSLGVSLVSLVSRANPPCTCAGAHIAHDFLHRTLGTLRTKDITY